VVATENCFEHMTRFSERLTGKTAPTDRHVDSFISIDRIGLHQLRKVRFLAGWVESELQCRVSYLNPTYEKQAFSTI